MSSLDSSVVNIILPVIKGDFSTDVATIEWVVVVYLLVVSSLLLSFGRLGDMRDDQNRRIEAYQNTDITDPQFHDLTIRSIDAGVLAASKVPHLLTEYRRPCHEEFAPRTLWSAFNSFSETLKDYDIQTLPRRTQALHGLCDMICHLS